MAYLAQQDDEEQKRLAAQGQVAPQTASSSGVLGAAAAPQSARAAGPAAPASPAQSNPTGYVNLQNYLALNQGQGQKMAQNAVNSLGGAGFQQNLDDAGHSFQDQAWRGGTGQFDYNGSDRGGQPSQAELQRESGLTYQGPQGLDPNALANFKAQASQLGADAQNLNSYSGLQGYFQGQNASKGGYTAGDSRLDSFLAGSAGAGALKGAADAYAGLGGQVDAAAGDASNYASQEAADTAKRAKDAAGQLVSAEGPQGALGGAGNGGGQLAGQKVRPKYGGLGGYPNPYGYRSP